MAIGSQWALFALMCLETLFVLFAWPFVQGVCCRHCGTGESPPVILSGIFGTERIEELSRYQFLGSGLREVCITSLLRFSSAKAIQLIVFDVLFWAWILVIRYLSGFSFHCEGRYVIRVVESVLAQVLIRERSSAWYFPIISCIWFENCIRLSRRTSE